MGAKLPKVFAYANERSFSQFLALNIPYTLEASPGSQFKELNMLLSLDAKQAKIIGIFIRRMMFT